MEDGTERTGRQEGGRRAVKRLVVVTDQSSAAHAIRMTLRQVAGCEVLGYVDGRGPQEGRYAQLRPDVVVIDDMQSRADTLDRIDEAARHRPEPVVVLLVATMRRDLLDAAFDAGADLALSKTVHPIALGTLLREVARGNVAGPSRRRRAEAAPGPLTPREAEILGLAAQGHTNGEIARRLWVTEPTVKFHLSNTYRKLGVTNRTEASLYAHTHALVEPDVSLAS